MTAVFFMQITRPVPAPTVVTQAPATMTVPGTPPALAWPAVGQAAVSVPDAGLFLQSGSEAPVAVASLTKIMTAYLVLRDHPIAPDAPGPRIVMSAVDEADSAANAKANATSIPVVAGQGWSERQLLDGLIVHSANDFADTLARWDAGSVQAFVDKMNRQAAALGMHGTHYADPSGIDQTGTSTAADQLRLTAAAMAIPAFAAVADQPAIAVPGVGFLANYVPVVGTDGVVGVKSGFTQAAMGCVVLAAQRQVAGRQVLVLAALTGQQGGSDPIRGADRTGIALIDTVAGALQQQSLLAAGRRVGSVSAPWSSTPVPLSTASGVTALVWPGDVVRYRLQVTHLGTRLRTAEQVGTLSVSDGTRRYEIPVLTGGGLAAPSLHWRFNRR
jgi:D-alanyl-D-alanine carboxypeptidase (penicillin-binding protein 5/6)